MDSRFHNQNSSQNATFALDYSTISKSQIIQKSNIPKKCLKNTYYKYLQKQPQMTCC